MEEGAAEASREGGDPIANQPAIVDDGAQKEASKQPPEGKQGEKEPEAEVAVAEAGSAPAEAAAAMPAAAAEAAAAAAEAAPTVDYAVEVTRIYQKHKPEKLQDREFVAQS